MEWKIKNDIEQLCLCVKRAVAVDSIRSEQVRKVNKT